MTTPVTITLIICITLIIVLSVLYATNEKCREVMDKYIFRYAVKEDAALVLQFIKDIAEYVNDKNEIKTSIKAKNYIKSHYNQYKSSQIQPKNYRQTPILLFQGVCY